MKRSEAVSDEIITAMSRACGVSIFFIELQQPRKHLLSLLRNERGLLTSMGFNNMMHAMCEY